VLGRQATPRTVVTWSAVLGLAFGLSNPDRRIAERVHDDPAYRRTLSDDAGRLGGNCPDRGGGVLSFNLGRRYACPAARS
jgi:hypothetical protein